MRVPNVVGGIVEGFPVSVEDARRAALMYLSYVGYKRESESLKRVEIAKVQLEAFRAYLREFEPGALLAYELWLMGSTKVGDKVVIEKNMGMKLWMAYQAFQSKAIQSVHVWEDLVGVEVSDGKLRYKKSGEKEITKSEFFKLVGKALEKKKNGS